MKPRDPTKEQTLFGAALVVADREGLEALTVQKVARQAGLAVGTLYVYFESKEDLLRKLYLRSKAGAGARLLDGFSPEAPFRQSVRLICRNQVAFLVENRLDVGFQRQFYRSGLTDDQTKELSRSYLAPLEALVVRGQREDLVKPWEPALVLRFVLAILKEAADAAQGLSREEQRILADRATDFCLAGLTP
jgi:AcrR family transcriptional regulator